MYKRQAECALILSLLARIQDRGDAVRLASTAALQAIGLSQPLPLEAESSLDHRSLDQALERLTALKPQAKHRLLQACAAVILADEMVVPSELEVLRAIGAVLNCPIPPLQIPAPPPQPG